MKDVSIFLTLLVYILDFSENELFDRSWVIIHELLNFKQARPSLANLLVKQSDSND